MKKKSKIFLIIVLIVLVPTMIIVFNKVMEPDKVLQVGHSVSKYQFEFTKEIKDQKKISEFEQLFEEVTFSTEEWDWETKDDIVFMINHKEGISTHFLRVWINGDEAIVLQSYDLENNTATIGKLSKSQLANLETIIE